MYQVLYRKWRPKTFDDVYGQSAITQTLRNELTSNRISHAYLFTGSHGTGKTTCAKILAKAVNCLHPVNGNPCNECEICRGIDNASVTDVSEIDAASNNGVDDVRAMRDETAYTPASAKYRVFIIDEVHMLSQSAFNALLKTLEEPPQYVIFILATTEVHKIPATILSRCQRFDFRRIDSKDMVGRLQYVAGQEGKSLDADAAELIASLSDGALRDALSILDTCITLNDHVDEQTVARAAGLSPREYITGIMRAVKNGEISDVISILDDIYTSSKSFTRLCEELIESYRAIMLIKTVKNPQSMLKMSGAQIKALSECAPLYSVPELIHIIKLLQTALDGMAYSSNKRIDMELCLMKAADPSIDDGLQAISRRLSALEGKIKMGDFTLPGAPDDGKQDDKKAGPNDTETTNETRAAAKAETENAFAKQPAQPRIQPVSNWSEILEELRNLCMPLYAVLDDSVAYISGNYVLIDAPNSLFRNLINQPGYKDHLRTAILNKTGRRFAIGPYKSIGQSAGSGPSPLESLAKKMKDNGVDVTIE